jgi:hypothetical protein
MASKSSLLILLSSEISLQKSTLTVEPHLATSTPPHPIYHLASLVYPSLRAHPLYRSLEQLCFALFTSRRRTHLSTARGSCLHQTLIELCSWHPRNDPVCHWQQLFDRRCAHLSRLTWEILPLRSEVFNPSCDRVTVADCCP